ncbi:MAG: hypothetical protein Fur0015_01470 [Ignavibacteriales bacterium]
MESDFELKLKYVKEFYQKNFYQATLKCLKWNGTNGREFGAKQPEDFIIEILEKILLKGKTCYLKTYDHFKNSVYYHLRFAMLNYFCLKEKKEDEVFPITDEFETTYENEIKYYGDEAIYNGIEFDEIKDEIYDLLNKEDRAEEFMVFEFLLDGYKREEIAKELNIEVEEVTNIKKRLQRILEKLTNKNKTLEREKNA